MVREQAETLRTGNNGNDPEANHVTGHDQHKKGHMGIFVLARPLLPGLYPYVVSGKVYNNTGFYHNSGK